MHEISEFTHAVETYLDLIRNQKKQLTAQGVDTLLKSCDVIRNMLDSREQETAIDEALRQQVGAELQALLADQGADRVMSQAQPVSSNTYTSNMHADAIAIPDATAQGWRIRFVPHETLFYSGNDPLRILRELRELGSEYQIELDHQALPELAEIDPELCYLSWTIRLTGDVSENDVRELFDWVEDECDLHIAPILSDEASAHVEDEQAAPAATLQSNPQTQVEPVAIVDLPAVEPPVATVAPVIANPKESATNKPAKTDSSVSSIRVDIEKVDNLINLVGELVITQSMLTELGNDFSMDKLDKLKAGLAQLLQNSKDLQENVLNIRMLPMSFAFSRFPRLVRDLCGRLGKKSIYKSKVNKRSWIKLCSNGLWILSCIWCATVSIMVLKCRMSALPKVSLKRE